MTLIRKHERVDGKFDVEPEIGKEYIFIDQHNMSPDWNQSWLIARVKGDGTLDAGDGDDYHLAEFTAYIDPSEEVAPVEVEYFNNKGRECFVIPRAPNIMVRFDRGHSEEAANLLNLKVKEKANDVN